MRVLRRNLILLGLIAVWGGNPTEAQRLGIDQVVDRIVQRENEEVKLLHKYHPIIETYVQDLRPDQEPSMVPATDHYFLARASLNDGTVQRPSEGKNTKTKSVKLGGLSGVFNKETTLDGFLNLIYLDSTAFDTQHYRLDYVRREFLGEVRCLVFDVTPLEKKGGDHFLGRVWVEDEDYAIVRFNGTNSSAEQSKGYRLHFDSWRLNTGPHVWLPGYVYSADADTSKNLSSHIAFQAQTLLWGYKQEQLITDEARTVATSQAALGSGNVEDGLDRLQAAGLLAPAGPVDKVLYTIANNLEVSNSLDIEPDVACRVLLSTTLESFTLGHTILISRGLLDVLPDESSLAMILAHELAHILSGHVLSDQWAVRDWSSILVQDRFDHFGFPIDAQIEEAANLKAAQILRNSPYKDKLGNSVLFLKMIGSQAQSLPSLISPHVKSQAPLANQLSAIALSSAVNKEQSIASLPLGSRIKLNPWTSQVDLLKSKPNALVSSQKRPDLLIQPSIPDLVLQTAAGPVPPDKPVPDDTNKPRE